MSFDQFPHAQRLELLEEDVPEQITALRLGIAWLMAQTNPAEAIDFLQRQGQVLSPDAKGNEVLRSELGDLAALVADLSGLPQPPR